MNEHTQIVTWVVGTGMAILVAFISILSLAHSSKRDISVCDERHRMIDKEIIAISQMAKKTMEDVIAINLLLVSIKATLEAQVKTEAGRWDRAELGHKG
jgi:predicted RND superfamily exporter protein